MTRILSLTLMVALTSFSALGAEGIVKARRNCKVAVQFDEENIRENARLSDACKEGILQRIGDKDDLNFKVVGENSEGSAPEFKISIRLTEGGGTPDSIGILLLQEDDKAASQSAESSRISSTINCQTLGFMLNKMPACSLY